MITKDQHILALESIYKAEKWKHFSEPIYSFRSTKRGQDLNSGRCTRDHLDTIRSIVSDALYKYSWKPIETAPKDGTLILVRDGQQVYTASWDQQHFFTGKTSWLSNGCCDNVTIIPDATLWMHIKPLVDGEF